jgi:hypothetical protein
MPGSELIAILGGTGPQGRGLGLRWALAGHAVVLGSRDAGRAQQQAADLKDLARGGDLRGADNVQAAASCDICVVAVPYEAQRATLEAVAEHLTGKLVVNCVNALAFDGGPRRVQVAAGSAAEECRDLLPGARVTSAFHTVSAAKLTDPGSALEGDVPVCGDDPADRARVVALADEIGMRGISAGPLHHSATLEALTALIISVNRQYRTSAGIAFTSVDRGRARS